VVRMIAASSGDSTINASRDSKSPVYAWRG